MTDAAQLNGRVGRPAAVSSAPAKAVAHTRLQNIDAVRGLVMLFMLVDHVREAFYGQSHGKRETSLFLAKRGAFLVLLEFTLAGFAWAAQTLPPTFGL